LSKYTYTVIKDVVEKVYELNAKKDLYESLGKIELDNISITVEAENEEEATQIRKAVTDIAMWELKP
jgi:hypothetical protein